MTICFSIFLILWNRLQGMSTPKVHLRIAEWLEKGWEQGDKNLLLMAFRSCGKSTIVGLFAAWLLLRDPNLRLLVMAGDQILAKKMVRNVKRIIERHPLTAGLMPDNPDQWASDRFTVKRDMELRDPSMLARGIGTNITGSRADIIIYDDVEVPNSCSTTEKRLELRQKLLEANFVLVAGGTQLYVGTPHHYFSIYAKQPRAEINEMHSFLQGYKRLEVPILNKAGYSAWPERYSLRDIEYLRTRTGPNKFDSQMMLRPVNILESRLDPFLLDFYVGDLVYTESQRLPCLYLNDTRMVSCTAWWDPAFGQTNEVVQNASQSRRDGSVFALIFTDENGRYYLHNVTYLKVNLSNEDEATQQCKQVSLLCRKFYVPSITIEINGIGKFLPSILRREMAAIDYPCGVVEHSASTNKDLRILEAFDSILAARLLMVHERVKWTPFLQEMREWRPSSSKIHDDGLDAVASAILQEPVRIVHRRSSVASKHWQGTQQINQIKSNFNPYQ